MKKLQIFALLLMIAFSSTINATARQKPLAIILDAEGVLVDFTIRERVEKGALDPEGGITEDYLKAIGSPLMLLNQLLLGECPLCNELCAYNAEFDDTSMGEDRNLAHLLVEWKKGALSHQDAREYVYEILDDVEEPKVCSILRQLAVILFDIEQCRAAHKPNTELIHLLCKIKRVSRCNDKQPIQYFLLSNVFPEWLKTSISSFLSMHCAEQCMFASDEAMLKPDPGFLDHFLSTFKLNPSQCLLIDDKKEMCEVARGKGMDAICYDKKKHGDFVKELRARGLRAE